MATTAIHHPWLQTGTPDGTLRTFWRHFIGLLTAQSAWTQTLPRQLINFNQHTSHCHRSCVFIRLVPLPRLLPHALAATMPASSACRSQFVHSLDLKQHMYGLVQNFTASFHQVNLSRPMYLPKRRIGYCLLPTWCFYFQSSCSLIFVRLSSIRSHCRILPSNLVFLLDSSPNALFHTCTAGKPKFHLWWRWLPEPLCHWL